MALEAQGRGVRFIDAPAAGTKGPAAAGTLLFVVGGAEEDVEGVRPLFDAMGRGVVHMGEVGMGTSAKMVVNALLAQAMLSFAEGLVLGESLGLERERLLEMLVGGPVVAPFIEGKRSKIESDEYEAAFPLKWMQKDLHLATQTGYERGVAMPSANLAKEIYRLADRAGLGDLDFSAIYRFLAESES
jgi:3-hydroxyisobutyrate dehydrogenase/glyoxylate/succinic semialdehyde reductase